MAIKKIARCFREQASRPNGSNPEDKRPHRHGLPFRYHGRFAQSGVAKYLLAHPRHEEHGESDKRQFDVKIWIREGFGRVGGQKEQARGDIDSQACPHNAEEPLQRLERDVAGDAEDAQIYYRIRSDHQGHTDGVKQQNEVEPKYGLRLAKPGADPGLLNGIKNYRYGQV